VRDSVQRDVLKDSNRQGDPAKRKKNYDQATTGNEFREFSRFPSLHPPAKTTDARPVVVPADAASGGSRVGLGTGNTRTAGAVSPAGAAGTRTQLVRLVAAEAATLNNIQQLRLVTAAAARESSFC